MMIDTPPNGTQPPSTTKAGRTHDTLKEKRDRYLKQLKTLGEIFPGYHHLEGRVSPQTLKTYGENSLLYLRFCNWDTAKALDPQTLRAWRHTMVTQTRLSPATINSRLSAVKSLVKNSAALGAIDRAVAYDFSLVEKVQHAALRHRLKKHTRFLITPEQVRDLCRAPDPMTLTGLRDRALFLTLASSGCRLSEVANLKTENIVPLGEGWGLHILGKGQEEERQAPLSGEAYAAIQRWLSARSYILKSPWVFTSCDTPNTAMAHPLSPIGVAHRVKKYARQIGLPHLSSHHLRRFVGTRIAKKHGIRQGQKALGHKLLTTFEKHYLLDELEEGLTDDLF